MRFSIVTRTASQHLGCIIDIPSVHLATVVDAIPANLLTAALAGTGRGGTGRSAWGIDDSSDGHRDGGTAAAMLLGVRDGSSQP